jgi:diamine N-acetyltransferase
MQSVLLKLRNVEPEDIDVLMEIENNEDNFRLSETLYPYSRYEIEQFVLNNSHDIFSNKQVRFMIEDKATGDVAGCVDLFDINPLHRRAGVGIIIKADYRNKGYAAETLEIIRDYAFGTLALHQLYCNIQAGNTRSIGLFEKAGYKRQGVKKDWEFYDGKFTDVLFYQLIKK